MSRVFGGIRQNGYVVRDIEAAMKHWVEVMGVGPWFYLERATTRPRCTAIFSPRAAKDCSTSPTGRNPSTQISRASKRGLRVGQAGCAGGPDGRFVHFATETHPGTVVEVSEVSGPKGSFFAHIRETARNWAGSDPIRRIGR